MDSKTLISEVYKALSLDPIIQNLLETDGSPEILNERIYRTKEILGISDGYTRMAIWDQLLSGTNNPQVLRNSLVVSIFCPTDKQHNTGVCYDIAGQVEKLIVALDKSLRASDKPFGLGIDRVIKQFNLRTSYGWFKAEVRFEYNFIN